MLYSKSGHIAFAHYPKTAGCTMFQWFTTAFPDAVHVDPDHPHMNVRRSLERLAGSDHHAGPRLSRTLDWLCQRKRKSSASPASLRVIGVLREPFEMLVSLYEFWKRTPPDMEVPAFIGAARSGTFHDFLWMAVVQKEMPRYEEFFDVGGPAWPNTRLIDFHSLQSGLTAVCDEFRILQATQLEHINAGGKRQRRLDEYRAEAGTLCLHVRGHFRWYYEQGAGLAVCGPSTSRRAA